MGYVYGVSAQPVVVVGHEDNVIASVDHSLWRGACVDILGYERLHAQVQCTFRSALIRTHLLPSECDGYSQVLPANPIEKRLEFPPSHLVGDRYSGEARVVSCLRAHACYSLRIR
jgi:hypothetical protein